MNALCRGGTVANGSCRHCRQATEELGKYELLVRQGPIPELVNCLSRLRPAQIGMACNMMVGAEVEAQYASDRRTVEFLQNHWSRVKTLGHTTLRSSPAVAATILAFPSLASSLPRDLAEGVDLLAWAASIASWSTTKLDLSGQQSFEALSAEDIFLAACYWDKTGTMPELASLNSRDGWSWTNVQQCLGGSNSELANNFKVFALQARMAEIAFPTIYQKIDPGGAAELRDLNKAELEKRQTWTLASKPPLPQEDWEVNRRMRVDVKCNLFFRSYEPKVGLRGFAIRIEAENPEGCIAGVVFFYSDDWGAGWSFIGFLKPGDVDRSSKEGRIAPFWFTMPDNCRADAIPKDDRDAAIIAELVASIDKSAEHTKDPRWPSLLPWADKIRLSEVDFPPDARDAIAFVAEALRNKRQKHFEITLWQAVTDAVIRIRSEGRPKSDADRVLKVFERIYGSAWLPVHLSRVGRRDWSQEQTLLERWNREVLSPLNKSWDNISCPSCGGKQVTVEPKTLTALGTLRGSLQCSCSSAIDVTLITHCWKCFHHPLVIGKNELCPDCKGLTCDWPNESGHVCGYCKRDCARTVRRWPEHGNWP